MTARWKSGDRLDPATLNDKAQDTIQGKDLPSGDPSDGELLRYNERLSSPQYEQFSDVRESFGVFGVQPHVEASNPVLSASDVSDVSSPGFVADPYLFYEGGDWHMFFEISSGSNGNQTIAHATSDDGLSWDYDQEVLTTSSDLSNPLVFKWNGNYWMFPQTTSDAKKIYKATTFPTSWGAESTLIDQSNQTFSGMADPQIFRWNGRWWMIFTDSGSTDSGAVYVFYSDTLTSGWTAHDNNPVIADNQSNRRPAGRVQVTGDEIFIPFQDTSTSDTIVVTGYIVDTLTTSSFSWSQVSNTPLWDTLSNSWRSDRAHHLDIWYGKDGSPVVAVDGSTGGSDFQIGIATLTRESPVFVGEGGRLRSSLAWDTLDVNGKLTASSDVSVDGNVDLNQILDYTISSDAKVLWDGSSRFFFQTFQSASATVLTLFGSNNRAAFNSIDDKGAQVRIEADTSPALLVDQGTSAPTIKVVGNTPIVKLSENNEVDWDIQALGGEFQVSIKGGATPIIVKGGAVDNSIRATATGVAIRTPAQNPDFGLHHAGGEYAHLGAPNSGPTTADMNDGSVIFSVDEDNNDLVVTVKKSGGTVVTGTVNLT